VRGREVPDPGAGPLGADPALDGGRARAPHPRRRPSRHHQTCTPRWTSPAAG
jgi:hypothetical protein